MMSLSRVHSHHGLKTAIAKPLNKGDDEMDHDDEGDKMDRDGDGDEMDHEFEGDEMDRDDEGDEMDH